MMDETQRAALEDDVHARCERGDFDGAATLALRALGGEIFGFLLATHRNETTASDAFAAFAEGLWSGLPPFQWNASLRAWAYAVARNVSRRARRDDARRERRVVGIGSSDLDRGVHRARGARPPHSRTTRARLAALPGTGVDTSSSSPRK